MRVTFFLLIVWIFSSCSDKSKPQSQKTSYWVNLKDSFATQRLEEFVIDAQLETSFKNFHRVKNKLVDSVISYGTPYLYSWQKNNSEFIAFTLFVDDGDHGDRIIYFIFDSKDSLRSATMVAVKGGEGGILYETRSRFIAKDTLYQTSAATTHWDLSKTDPWSHRLSKSKGDSTFSHLIILNDGTILEKQFAEKNELNLE